MRIRSATTEDIDALLALLLQVHEVHAKARPDLFGYGARKYERPELEKLLKQDNFYILVAEHEGKVIGHCFAEREITTLEGPASAGTLYIDDLCVDEHARGTGAGKALMEAARELGRDLGCYNLTLSVWRGNESARAFYEHLGLIEQKRYLEEIL